MITKETKKKQDSILDAAHRLALAPATVVVHDRIDLEIVTKVGKTTKMRVVHG